MDGYTPPAAETSCHVPSPLSRMQSQSHNNTFRSKHGKAAVRPRPLNTAPTSAVPVPIPNASVIPGNTLPSAPASPPTPAPSPTPGQRRPGFAAWDAEDLELDDEDGLENVSTRTSRASLAGSGASFRERRILDEYAQMSNQQRQALLAQLLEMSDGKTLSFVSAFVGPRLKRDPFSVLPNELCLRVLTFIEDARTLARSSQVSKRWRELVSDDMAWKSLCEKHAYRRLSDGDEREQRIGSSARRIPSRDVEDGGGEEGGGRNPYGWSQPRANDPLVSSLSSSAPDLTRRPSLLSTPSTSALPQGLQSHHTRSISSAPRERDHARRPKAVSYRSHFKAKYQTETAWRHGGALKSQQITPDQGVVTSLHLTDKYIIVALDNAKIHVFSSGGAGSESEMGRHLRCLQGHVMGVWAMVPVPAYTDSATGEQIGDRLVSGGCDRDVRVWDLASGTAIHMLRGHTSTVRCLKLSGRDIAISGSRDTTLRIWNIRTGTLLHILQGHQASVRCLEIHGDLCVSGSYDTTARIWSISTGQCLKVLQGHFSQIYAVAFDGRRVATGSLDTSVRVWDARTGACLAQLQGHTSLVGQLQLRGDTLVTGGSDGSVRVWSLRTYSAVHRLAAHDNSVTSLQFRDGRIVSGGSDGRVKVWDLSNGRLVRELGNPAEAVWRVVFEEEKAVVLASRGGKTVMEVWSFAPPPDAFSSSRQLADHLLSPSSSDFRSNSSSPMSMPAITPYQDPEFGELPSYEVNEEQQEARRKAMEAEVVRNEEVLTRREEIADEVMTDVYERQGQEEAAEFGGDGQV